MPRALEWARVTVLGVAAVVGCAGGPPPVAMQKSKASRADADPAPRQVASSTAQRTGRERPPTDVEVPGAADGDERTIRALEKSASLYRQFIERAGDDPEYAEAVERSRERLEDIRDTLEFVRRGIHERRRQPQR